MAAPGGRTKALSDASLERQIRTLQDWPNKANRATREKPAADSYKQHNWPESQVKSIFYRPTRLASHFIHISHCKSHSSRLHSISTVRPADYSISISVPLPSTSISISTANPFRILFCSQFWLHLAPRCSSKDVCTPRAISTFHQNPEATQFAASSSFRVASPGFN